MIYVICQDHRSGGERRAKKASGGGKMGTDLKGGEQLHLNSQPFLLLLFPFSQGSPLSPSVFHINEKVAYSVGEAAQKTDIVVAVAPRFRAANI